MITMTFVCDYCGVTFQKTNYKSVLRLYRKKYCCKNHAILAVGGTYRPAVDKRVDSSGYVQIKMVGHPMSRGNKWVPEHRLVMSQIIGRNLTRKETVHHINGNKQDNRPENLLMLPLPLHTKNDKCKGCIIRKEYSNSQNYKDNNYYFDLIPRESFLL